LGQATQQRNLPSQVIKRRLSLLEPIEVQGLTIRPGEKVLLVIGDETILRTYDHKSPHGEAFLKREVYSTHPKHDTGPFSLDMLRHPDVLTGMIREIDVAE
jgi:hypothetical protein